MRILHVTNVYPDERRPGYGVFIKEQVDSLRAIQGVDNDVMYIDVGNSGRVAYFRALKRLRADVRNYDVVHAHHLFSAVIAILAGARRRLVVSFLGGKFDMVGGWQWLGGPIFCLVRRLVSAVIIKQMLSPCLLNVHFIPNGIDIARFDVSSREAARNRLGCKPEDLVLLFVSAGSLERKEKRKDLFDKVAGALAERTRKRVVTMYMSNVPRNQVADYFNAATCHVLTSDFEGSPNSVKEALASGCPVVSRAVGDVPRLLAGVPFCSMFNTDDEALSPRILEHIVELCAIDHEIRVGVRSAFLQNVSETHEVAAQILRVYSMVCGKGQAK